MLIRGLLASPLGFGVGLAMGALGGGGSLLAVPVLVYVVGQTTQEATSTSLVVVGAAALVGLIGYLRADRVRLRAGLVFGAAGMVTAVGGSILNEILDPDVLLLAFAGVMLAGGFVMRLGRSEREATFHKWRDGVSLFQVVPVVVLGALVGFATGLFGVGGGFLVVPVLVLALGVEVGAAVGTSLLVISMNATAGVATRLTAGSIEWEVAAPFAVTTLAGVLVGRRLAAHTSSSQLQSAFAAVIILIAIGTGIQAALALA